MAAGPGAEDKGRVKEQREPAVAHIEGQQQEGWQQHHTEECIQNPRQPRPFVPNGPQNVIEKAQNCAGGGGLHKLNRLKQDGLLHQPKSRAKKPPPEGCSSS